MTTLLPWTFSSDDPAGRELENRLQDVFDFITAGGVDTGGRSVKVRAGAGTLAWPGGAVASTALVVSHGLGSTPVSVVAQVGANTGVTLFPSLGVFSLTSSQFTAQACTVDGSNPLNTATTAFYWVAIG